MTQQPRQPGRPLRVLHVLHSLRRAGAEQLVYELAAGNPQTLQVGVICLDGLGVLADELQKLGCPIYLTDRREGIDRRQPARVADAIADFQPDVIQAHQYTPFFYAALGWMRRPTGRLIFTEHGRHFPDVVGWKRRWVNKLFLVRTCSAVTAVCRFTAERLIQREGMPVSMVRVIYNGVDPSRFDLGLSRDQARLATGLPADVPIVIQVGRFQSVKDHPTAVRAWARVCEQNPDALLVFAGDGPDREAIETQVRDAGLAERVRFLGVRADVPELLAAAEVMLMTSLSEAHSVALLEAMASRLPIVSTDVGGIPETVAHNRSGLLAPVGDDAALARAMLGLLDDPTRRRNMGRVGWEIMKRHFLRSDMHERYLALYHALADGADA